MTFISLISESYQLLFYRPYCLPSYVPAFYLPYILPRFYISIAYTYWLLFQQCQLNSSLWCSSTQRHRRLEFHHSSHSYYNGLNQRVIINPMILPFHNCYRIPSCVPALHTLHTAEVSSDPCDELRWTFLNISFTLIQWLISEGAMACSQQFAGVAYLVHVLFHFC